MRKRCCITYEEAMLLEFSSFISVKQVIYFLQKYNRVTVTLSCVITKNNLYLNLLVTHQILLCVAIQFHQVLQCFLLSNGWIIFSRLNTIKKQKIVFSFSPLILHAVFFSFKENHYRKQNNHPQGFPHEGIRISH